MALEILNGQIFYNWTVTDETIVKSECGKKTYCKCMCICGKEKLVRRSTLNRGTSRGCGCTTNKTHGMKHTKFYTVWGGMKGRCNNPSSESYYRYGGRGITVCERWHIFNNFMEDMYESYVEHLKANDGDTTIDRINTDGNYEPSNCRWSTRLVQENNKSTNRYIEIDGITRTLVEWSREYNIPISTLTKRLESGIEIKKALTTTVRRKGVDLKKQDYVGLTLEFARKIIEENKTMTIAANELGYRYDTGNKMLHEILPDINIDLYNKIMGARK